MGAAGWATLDDVLARAHAIGLLGGDTTDEHVRIGQVFADVLPGSGRAADLGSGGGVPGLVVALARPGLEVLLIESSQRRADHLRWAVGRLELGTRVRVLEQPVEQVGRAVRWRGTCDAVMARGFGPPPTVAECAAPLLQVGGLLLVSEPPDASGTRWRGVEDAGLPLRLDRVVADPAVDLAVLRSTGPCPDRFPRAVGVPRRRPLHFG